MPRIILYELKKILSLPVLVLLAASVCILVIAPLSRYFSFAAYNGLPPREYRALSMQYSGPLNRALADRALADWRKLPDDYSMEETDEQRARRQILRQLGAEYAFSPEPAELPENASADAARRLSAALGSLSYPESRHCYYEGWREYLAAMNAEGAWLCAALVAFGIAALFSGEAASFMASSVRTARHGRIGLTAAKLAAAGIYGASCAALCALLPLGMCAALFGLQGGELPVQYAAKVAYPFTLAGYAGLRAAMFLLGGLALAAVTAALSALLPSATAPAAMGLAVFLAPTVCAMLRLESPAMESVMRYMPSRLLLPDEVLGKVQAAMLWREPFLQPQWLALLWAALIPLLCLLAGAVWLRAEREEPVIQD